MKRVLALVLAIVMTFSLAACGKEQIAEKICSNCGESNSKDVAFCSYCGASFNGGDEDISNYYPSSSTDIPSTSSQDHTHSYSKATCTSPAQCSCGATKGNALGHNYNAGVCKTCGKKDPNYKPIIKKISLNTPVTVSSNHEYRLGDLKITVLGFEKTTWKADEYRYHEDDPDSMAPAFKALGKTEEIGMLKLIITKISYDDPENPDNIWLEDVLKTYDEDGIALNAINTGWNYGSYEVALNETVDIKKGETTRVAVPYVYDISNNSLRVILGEKYEVEVPIVQ